MSRALEKFITVIVKITIRITVAILLKEGVVRQVSIMQIHSLYR